MREFLEILKVIFLGIIEGITEWLPISSTGHMILADEFIKLNVSDGFKEMFLVVIQLGAILAVPVVFWKKLFPFGKGVDSAEKKRIWSLWFKVAVGVAPAAVLGFLLDDILDKHLYNYVVVSIALVVYGIIFIWVEKLKNKKSYRVERAEDISYGDALKIGTFQILSLIPGTSRSGSTIIGGMLSGVSRSASAEFSFFMAIPIMLGASGLKVLKFLVRGLSATPEQLILLLIAIATSFVVSLAAIKFLTDFVKRHDFKPFGVYRIILGIVVVVYFVSTSII